MCESLAPRLDLPTVHSTLNLHLALNLKRTNVMTTKLNRFKGALLGLAAGDDLPIARVPDQVERDSPVLPRSPDQARERTRDLAHKIRHRHGIG